MAERHGGAVLRVIKSPQSPFGEKILDWIHPPGGLGAATGWHQRMHRGLQGTLKAVDRTLA
jgi:hypothetical protein